MGKRIGLVCVALGILCLLGALGLVIYNRWEEAQAARNTEVLLEQVQLAMEEDAPQAEPSAQPAEMATIQVDGYDCIGILSVPALELELPVLTDWSYAKLKVAPCLYYGAYYEENFVIAAHNYDVHFGRLSQLLPGDRVLFTDVAGRSHSYEVVLLETLPKEATEEMIASGFDLSLYTCTPGGANRVTVRCIKK